MRSVVLLGVLLLPALAGAQAVAGAGDDAVMVPRGAVRFQMGYDWTRFFERYGSGRGGRKTGALELLGAGFSFDSLGPRQLENLSPIETNIRALAAMPDFNASLGKTVVRVRDRIETTPLGVELGLTSFLSLGVVVPFVTATSEVDFRLNPAGREATLGFNPALDPKNPNTNTALLAAFQTASATLGQRLATCTTAGAADYCPALIANAAAARDLRAAADNFAALLGRVYGGVAGQKPDLFIPIAGTTAQRAIEAQVKAFSALYTAFTGTGIVGTVPFATPLTTADAQGALFTDRQFGIGAKPFGTNVTRSMGDVDIALKLKLFDTFGGAPNARLAPSGFNLRQSFGAMYRLGTGKLGAPDAFTDLGTGSHVNAMEGRSFTDLLFGSHFWVSIVGRFNRSQADTRVMRIPASPDQPLTAAYRQQTVTRQLGDAYDVAVNPRWTLNEYVGLSGHYYYRHKAADAYTGTFSVVDLAGKPLTIDASALTFDTEAEEHRFGFGATFSTLSEWERGRARFPVDISWVHYQTTNGAGGNVPKLRIDQVQLRLYRKLFGR